MTLLAPLLVATVISNANVITMNRAAPRARCVAVEGERIVAVGATPDACRRGGAKQIDAHGATLIPGINDAHVHFGLGLTIGRAPRISPLPRPRWLDAVRAAASRSPRDAWVVVRSDELPDGVGRAHDLDFIDHPVLVVTRRGALFNTLGKSAAELDGAVPHGFVGGRYVAAALDTVSWAQRPADILAAARALLEKARTNGITSMQLLNEEMPELFEHLRKRGELTLRVRFVPLGYRFDTMLYRPDWRARAPAWVRVEGVKYFHDDPAPLSRRERSEIIAFALQHRLPVVMHVLGRYSLRQVLDDVEAKTAGNPTAARLFRIEHVDEARAEDARRIARLGMVVCANPTLIAEWKSARLGPLRTLLDAGVRLSLGADWIGDGYGRPLAPLENIALAVTHAGYGQSERISAAEALEAYTLGSAYGEGLEREKGSIEVGKLADLVLLSADPTAASADAVRQIRVKMTMVGGRVVYAR